MPIRIECPHCGKGIKAADKYAGKQVNCPGCGGRIDMPLPLTPPPPIGKPHEALEVTVACPFCSEPIKPTARKCRHCGEFLDTTGSERQVRTIEATGKKWKLAQLLGVCGIVIGAVLFFTGMAELQDGSQGGSGAPTGALLLIVGFTSYVVGRVGGWWFHG